MIRPSAHTTLAPPSIPHILQTAVDPLPTLTGVAALLVGLAFLVHGGRDSLGALRVARATTTDPRSVQPGDRRVRISGRARPPSGAHEGADDGEDAAETLPAPFTREQCLCCAYDVSEYRSQGRSRSWVSIDSGEAGVPFRVIDGGSPFVVGDASARRTALRLVGRSAVPVLLGLVSLAVAAVALAPALGGIGGVFVG